MQTTKKRPMSFLRSHRTFQDLLEQEKRRTAPSSRHYSRKTLKLDQEHEKNRKAAVVASCEAPAAFSSSEAERIAAFRRRLFRLLHPATADKPAVAFHRFIVFRIHCPKINFRAEQPQMNEFKLADLQRLAPPRDRNVKHFFIL